MASVRDYTDPYISIYPPVKIGVCEVCHGAPGSGWDICYSCYLTRSQVTEPTNLVVPISFYRLGEQLHHVLRNYKSGYPVLSQNRLKLQVASTIGRFLSGHRSCIEAAAGRSWGVITSVPSSQNRPGVHPLEEAIRMVVALGPQYERLLQPGTETIGHRRASDNGYAVTRDVHDASVLLIDDTLTTGARLQSAASALHLAGARVVAGIVVGRVVGTSNAQLHCRKQPRQIAMDYHLLPRRKDRSYSSARFFCSSWWIRSFR